MHGQFVWYELTTPDPTAAQQFYPRFTNWGTQKFDNDYTMWTTGGAPFAGIFRLGSEMRDQGVPPNWMPYVESSDVDATARLATALGGKVITGPTDIPPGRFAVLQDPQGATFGIYKKKDGLSGAWDGTPIVGRFSWHELMTTDWKAAFEFYRKLFGWEDTSQMDMGGGNMYMMFSKGRMYGAMYNRPPEMASMRPFWLCYIHVKDVGKAVEIATKAGGFVQRPRMPIPGGTIAVLGDPQGAGFALHDMTPVVAALKQPAKPKAKKAAKAAAKKKTAKAGAKKKTVRASAKKKTAKSGAKKRGKAKPKPKAKRVSKGRAIAKKKSAKKGKRRR